MKHYSYIILFFSLAFLQDVQLSIANIDTTTNSLDIHIINTEEVSSFQFQVLGISMTNVFGDDELTGQNGFILDTSDDNFILGFGSGNIIPESDGQWLSLLDRSVLNIENGQTQLLIRPNETRAYYIHE